MRGRLPDVLNLRVWTETQRAIRECVFVCVSTYISDLRMCVNMIFFFFFKECLSICPGSHPSQYGDKRLSVSSVRDACTFARTYPRRACVCVCVQNRRGSVLWFRKWTLDLRTRWRPASSAYIVYLSRYTTTGGAAFVYSTAGRRHLAGIVYNMYFDRLQV